jgi:hypothetical protein
MKKFSIAIALLVSIPLCSASFLSAQSMDDLNLQIHGYATQGFIYSNHNSWDSTASENGSAAFTEAVVNLSAQPLPKLRIGIQARYFLLGEYGNSITLDWAQADYRVNEHFGFRAGDVKTPSGMLNETQDIDPAQLWVLLPQAVYPIASRDTLLDHYGGVVYGAFSLGESLGKLEYRAYGGTREVNGNDGFFQLFRDEGLTLPNGIRGPVYGATLKWHPPVAGLMFGVNEDIEHPSGNITAGALSGTYQDSRLKVPYFFGKYEHGNLMFAGEYNRIATNATVQFPGLPASITPNDFRAFYLMTSYKIGSKLTAGMYYSSFINRQAPFNTFRYEKDWTLAARYDFSPYLYAKLEQHIIDGTGVGFAASDNPNLQPDTRMTMFKLGVTF